MMKNMFKLFSGICLSFVFVFGCATETSAQKVPAEVQAIAGTFTGSWTSYAVNDKGEIVKQAAWTDVIKAEKPTAAADRAYVETIDEMTFEGGRIPPQKITGKEGYLLNKDGSLGDYFIEIFGQTIPMKRLSKDTWAYSVAANPQEFRALGDRFVSATHVLVKTTLMDGAVETHNISRITTLKWKDAEGKERLTQFVSLQGQHRKAK
ncbi:MAG TPA: hypothetical protein VIL74_23455 [Pyrinomonadaceae bacterium]|jgi:hypothetical protein